MGMGDLLPGRTALGPDAGWSVYRSLTSHHIRNQQSRGGHLHFSNLRHIDTAKGEHCHLRIPSLLMRARAQATVRVWKMRSIDIPRPILRGAVLNGLAWVP